MEEKRKAFAKLRELYLSEHYKNYPNIPDYVKTVPSYTDKTANGLTKMIIHFIRLNGGQAERINCTGRIIDNRQTVADVMGNVRTIGSIKYGKTAGTRGTADISATIKGRSVKIEVKIGRDKQSSYQKQYQKNIEAAGGIYVIARDFTGFYEWYILKFGSHGKR
jgi:hypothetical protein